METPTATNDKNADLPAGDEASKTASLHDSPQPQDSKDSHPNEEHFNNDAISLPEIPKTKELDVLSTTTPIVSNTSPVVQSKKVKGHNDAVCATKVMNDLQGLPATHHHGQNEYHLETKKGHARTSMKTRAKDIAHTTEHIYEEAMWCAPMRWIGHFPRNFPRTYALFFGMILPLWVLIFLAYGFGFLLAYLEVETEIDYNDSIMEAIATMNYHRVEQGRFLNATIECVRRYDNGNENTSTTNLMPFIMVNRSRFVNTVIACQSDIIDEIYEFEALRANSSLAFESPTFNWNRCWNETELPKHNALVFHPRDEIIRASHPDEQLKVFRAEWEQQQASLYAEYLPENATAQEERDAYFQSIADASGGGTCEYNVGGTAWFFFTVMTTIGYGNQAPQTYEGRWLIYTAGLASLVLFGAVLGTSAYILMTLYNDLVSRWGFASRWLQYPSVGVLLWGTIWMSWSVVIAIDVQWWWEHRLPSFEANRYDSFWFAYISTSTIGLGDYFLQPEVMFAGDTLKFSVEFLVGFIFLSTFFAKLVEFVATKLPQRQNSLEARLKATRLLACWKRGVTPWDRNFQPSSSSSSQQGRENAHGDHPAFDTSDSESPPDTDSYERVNILFKLLPLDQQHNHPMNSETASASASASAMTNGEVDPMDVEEELLIELFQSLQNRKHGNVSKDLRQICRDETRGLSKEAAPEKTRVLAVPTATGTRVEIVDA